MNIRIILSALSMGVVLTGHAADFSLTSQDIAENRPLTSREVFQGFGCEGVIRLRNCPGPTPRRRLKVTQSRSMTLMRRPAAAGGIGQWSTYRLQPKVCQAGSVRTCLPVPYKDEPIMANRDLAGRALLWGISPIAINSPYGR